VDLWIDDHIKDARAVGLKRHALEHLCDAQLLARLVARLAPVGQRVLQANTRHRP
jgi:hypothetical protein